jgi:hypothetical protein
MLKALIAGEGTGKASICSWPHQRLVLDACLFSKWLEKDFWQRQLAESSS